MATAPAPPEPLPVSAWLSAKMVDLLACACSSLETYGVGPVCWCGLQTGETTWEGCGECDNGACGMSYVRLVRAFPYTAFPAIEELTHCDTAVGFDLELGAMRCVPVNEDGSGLTPSQSLSLALDTVADMGALHRAISCCFDIDPTNLVEWVPLGPQGACVGGAWTFQIGMV